MIRCHTLRRMAVMKKSKNNTCFCGCGDKVFTYSFGEMQTTTTIMENSSEISQRTTVTNSKQPSNLPPRYLPPKSLNHYTTVIFAYKYL